MSVPAGTSHPWSNSLHGTRVAHFDKMQIKPLISGPLGYGYQKGISTMGQAPHFHQYGPMGRGVHHYTPYYYRSTRGFS